MPAMTRRQFTKSTALGGIAFATSQHRILGANGDIRVACIGTGGRGGAHLKSFRGIKGVRVIALCDADRAVIAKRKQSFEKDEKYGKIEGYVDYRKLLERDDLDAVVIATPNHWHSLITIHACQAGKDVYVEKPVCHTIWEGGQMVEAQRKYKRIVQAGSQNRSDVGLLEFFSNLHAGEYGKVLSVRGLCYRRRSGIGKRLETPLKPPASVDYNLWLGPAADLPIHRPRFHYDWHWIWNTGNGDIGNQGPHETNLIGWALGDKGMPTRTVSFGGRFGWNDAGETPNMQFTASEWNGVPIYFEVRDMSLHPDKKGGPNYKGVSVGVLITCEGGEFRGGRGGGWLYDEKGERVKQFKGDSGRKHRANFIEALRSRKVEDLRAPVHENHRTCILAHMGEISHRIGAGVQPDELRERMSGDKEAMDAIERFSGQLENWKIDFAKEPWILGPSLEFDPETLQFKGAFADEANALARRKDREPFVVPEQV